jgi:hypothetical protein
MKIVERTVKLWAYLSMILCVAIIIFLFAFVFIKGGAKLSLEFIFSSPKGMVLGSEGGIFPAIVGSLCMSLLALSFAIVPSLAIALYVTFFCNVSKFRDFIRFILYAISGIPSIVLGLFVYSLLIKRLGLGRSIFCAAISLAIMIMPFMESRIEKSFLEVPRSMIIASKALACPLSYMVFKIILPMCSGEIFSAMIIGTCFAMGATAPIMFTGAVAYASIPNSVFRPAMALPLHLYLLVSQGETSMPTAYATAGVMMFILLVSNIAVNLFRGKRWKMQ